MVNTEMEQDIVEKKLTSTTKPTHILFDFDVIAYRAGFVSQTTVTNEDGTKEVVPGVVEYALGTAKSIINHVCAELDIYEYSGYLTDSNIKNNFRASIKGNLQYKANRKEFVKPVYLEDIRQYLLKYHEAELVIGEEADDRLGIIQTKYGDKTVIASIDKDLRQIPGWHLNTMNNQLIYSQDPGTIELIRDKEGKPKKLIGTGFKWFCAQMLMGDKADNIAGLSGMGNSHAYNALANIVTPKDLWREVKFRYTQVGKTDEELLGTANLLWIRRAENQEFTEDLVEEIHDSKDTRNTKS
jgi:5'-3' exonuclease